MGIQPRGILAVNHRRRDDRAVYSLVLQVAIRLRYQLDRSPNLNGGLQIRFYMGNWGARLWYLSLDRQHVFSSQDRGRTDIKYRHFLVFYRFTYSLSTLLSHITSSKYIVPYHQTTHHFFFLPSLATLYDFILSATPFVQSRATLMPASFFLT